MTNLQLFMKLHEAGFKIANRRGLNLQSITRAPKTGTVGTCSHDGHIKIRIQNFTSERIYFFENGRTLAHELAHLRHHNHGPEFWQFAAELCEDVSKELGHIVLPEKVMMR